MGPSIQDSCRTSDSTTVELVVGRIVAVLVVEPVTVGVLTPVGHGYLFALLPILAHDVCADYDRRAADDDDVARAGGAVGQGGREASPARATVNAAAKIRCFI